MDRAWWKEYAGGIDGQFELWTTTREAARVYGLNCIGGETGGGISKRPGHIKRGGNSGFQAVSLALHFGAARVILLGYDMQFTSGQMHWHADHGNGLGNPVLQKMKGWHQHFAELARQSAVPIVNATRQTALKCFPRLDLLESLAEPAAHSTGSKGSLRSRAGKAGVLRGGLHHQQARRG